jgi:hypothetical protein
VEGISDQQLARELAEEGAALRGRAAPRLAGDRMVLEQAVDGGFRQLTGSCPLGAHEHADDPFDGTTRSLAFGAQDEVGQVGADVGRAEISAVPGEERREAVLLVDVIPAPNGDCGDAFERAVGPLPAALGSLETQSHHVAVLELGADERAEDGDAKECDVLLGLFVHAPVVSGGCRHSGWDRLRPWGRGGEGPESARAT